MSEQERFLLYHFVISLARIGCIPGHFRCDNTNPALKADSVYSESISGILLSDLWDKYER